VFILVSVLLELDLGFLNMRYGSILLFLLNTIPRPVAMPRDWRVYFQNTFFWETISTIGPELRLLIRSLITCKNIFHFS